MARRGSVAAALASLSMDQYWDALHDEGYDEMAMIKDLSEAEATELADSVGMKGGHKKKFLRLVQEGEGAAATRTTTTQQRKFHH